MIGALQRWLRLGCLAVVMAASAAALRTPAAPVRPNILLVSIDSLRADHVHAYGYARETTPTIDRLAQDGVLFRSAISPSAWTLPTHVTLLTGVPPEAHGVIDSWKRLDERAIALAEVLHAAGYATAAVVSGPLLRSIYGHAQGFEVYDDHMVAARRDSGRGETSSWVVKAAVEWLEKWSRGGRRQPFFLFVHMWDVHYDYAPPPPYDSMFDPEYRGTVNADDFERNQSIRRGMAPRDLEHVIALYDGEIRYTDEHLGKVIAWLVRAGLLDDTIVVVTADHGDEFFEHGHKGHSKSLYDEMVHVPLVMRYPRRIASGQVIEQQVRLMDVAPTLLGLTGVERPAGFGGEEVPRPVSATDLSPWLTGATRDAFPSLIAFTSVNTWGTPVESVRTDERKIIQSLREKRPKAYLFELEQDPGERRNRLREAVADPSAKALWERLEGWLTHWTGRKTLARPLKLGTDQEERLRSLGYIH